jgi:hypothetical protein
MILPFAPERAARSAETRPPLESDFPPLPADWCYLCWSCCCLDAEAWHSDPQPQTLTDTARHLAFVATAGFPDLADWTAGQIALVRAIADQLRRYAAIAERRAG